MFLKPFVLFFLIFINFSFSNERSLVENIDQNNVALIVGVSHGLPGIDIDVNNIKTISMHSAYQFKPTIIEDSEGTINNVKEELTLLAEEASFTGTLLFYYSGHGGIGTLWLEDDIVKIEELREAIEEGRSRVGAPLERFVFISDSCHSGSLIDPLNLFDLRNEALVTELVAQKIVDIFTAPSRNKDSIPYFKKLIVIASSRANESSLADYNGSVFTNAFVKAFKETEKNNGTMKDLVFLSQKYTTNHHPVAKFIPEDLESEPLIP